MGRDGVKAAAKKATDAVVASVYDQKDDFRKLTAGDGDDDSELSLDDVTSAEFAGHHKSPDQACACCHHFKPAAECYSMKCGDGSGEFCWSPTSKGIHWGWGAIGKKSYRAGADECSASQKNKVCKLPCVAQGTC